MEDFEDDTHICLKCRTTIIGLEHYVSHRKNNCNKQTDQKSSLPSQLLTTDESFNLKADDFFSSLELQSSSKKLVQPSSSTKISNGVLTRSKLTASTRDLEPSKSDWIGGHQLKELDYDDNQSKLIKAVANLERRKEDIGKKEIPRIHVYDESEDESEDYEYDDETSDEDAPPRNHTGGKWKPSSPIYWKSMQPERDWRCPPPNFTGGKWKPIPTKRIISPPPTHTKGKWKPGHQPKDNEDIPPPEFTGGKWSQSKKQEYSSLLQSTQKESGNLSQTLQRDGRKIILLQIILKESGNLKQRKYHQITLKASGFHQQQNLLKLILISQKILL
ncbi:hypothetical protein HHI36_008791 [Cryptolaemus montrouzieri]|uniref:Uncharacterized protein n=1 Tax=Cryptolaemus montrouzieri TaxID=559131 RepID=A0ABD2MTD6_9CUCU